MEKVKSLSASIACKQRGRQKRMLSDVNIMEKGMYQLCITMIHKNKRKGKHLPSPKYEFYIISLFFFHRLRRCLKQTPWTVAQVITVESWRPRVARVMLQMPTAWGKKNMMFIEAQVYSCLIAREQTSWETLMNLLTFAFFWSSARREIRDLTL